MNEEIKSLIKLNKELKEIRENKKEAASSQKYEVAAAFRDDERNKINELEEVAGLGVIDFGDEGISRKVMQDFYKVLDFIKEEDSNLTPALLRKLSQDVRIAEGTAEVATLKIRTAEEKVKSLNQRLLDQMSWIHIVDSRPQMVENGKNDKTSWRQSEEVVILYVREDGAYDICMGRYVEEDKGVHDKIYYFAVKTDLEGIDMNRVKGWMPLPDKKFRNISF